MKNQNKKKTLWQHSETPEDWIDDFTAGTDRDFDLYLAPYDILGSIAHSRMLFESQLLTEDELNKITRVLVEIYRTVNDHEFSIETGVEDIHSQIELILTRKLGDTGKKIHTGRSRNDQVLLDLRLFLRDRIRDLVHVTESLFELLIDLSERHKEIFMPGYTHMQAAMPSSFGLWFAAYAESLTDDLAQLRTAYALINRNPLGSAAGYGTSLPIDRQLTTQLLAFEDLNYNAIYAQMGRGRTERVLSQAMTSFAETIGKLAADCILFMSENFGFIRFPERLTTGSSIMPHKRNPDVFEIIRARCNRIKSLPNEIMLICSNLTHGYHRDFQIIKEHLIPGLFDLGSCLKRSRTMIAAIQVNKDLKEDPRYEILGSVEAVNQLVQKGMPFRDAYLRVSEDIRNGTFRPPEHVRYTHQGSTGNLCNSRLVEIKNSQISGFKFEELDRISDLLK